jgi:hypothetical protein
VKSLFAKFLILLTVCAVMGALSGCRQPVGTIDSGNSGSGNGNGNGNGKTDELNFMWLVPNRFLYETEERFERDFDLQIMVAENGVVKEIAPSDPNVKIEIIENPGLTSESVTVVTGLYYPFSLPGRHIVQVTYIDKTARYSIEVRGTFTGGGDGSDFLDLVWL